jgi:Copper transport outer membrane protein, MctB
VIDFRYHIVSLISVFLALAVGIALGAGPLEQTIGNTLTGQVEVLREDRDALRAELDETQAAVDRQAVFIEGTAPRLLSGTLADRRVAVVSLGAVDEDSRVAVEEQLADAGASVSARVQVTDQWTDPSLRSFRQALAANLVTYLDPAPETSAGTETELAEALAQGLTGADPAAPDQLSEPAGIILELLANGDSELITLAEPVTAPADAVVVLGADQPPATEEEGAEDAAADVVAAHVAVVSAAQARSDGAVLAGGPAVPGDIVSTVLADSDLAAALSTVTGFGGVTGQVSVPLALNAQIGGKVGHYGFGDGLTAVPEPVSLPPVDRTPVVPAPPAG